MLKALMVITMVTGATYEVKLPTMEQCMAESVPVKSQNDVDSVTCLPRTDDPAVRLPTELFSQFMDLIFMLEEQRKWGCEERCEDSWQPGENYYPPQS